MKKLLPFILIGGAVVFYFLSRGGTAKRIRVYFKDLTFGKMSGLIPEIFARFRIVNPTNTPVSVDSIAGDIYFNQQQLASVQNLSRINIPANSEIVYPIKIQVSAISVLTTIYRFIKNKERLKITFDGSINTTGIVIPIQQTIVQG